MRMGASTETVQFLLLSSISAVSLFQNKVEKRSSPD